MPIFFQHPVSETTRIGIWKIEETVDFFINNVPQHRDVTHPHKRLQHLAGRFLLRFLFPAFPHELIQIADTRKPYLPDEQYHFSISHCGDYAAAIVSEDRRVGIDIEMPVEKIVRIRDKFLSDKEKEIFNLSEQTSFTKAPAASDYRLPTVLWSAKESVFKWYGEGNVDFRKHILLKKQHQEKEIIDCHFTKTGQSLEIHYKNFENLVMAWIVS